MRTKHFLRSFVYSKVPYMAMGVIFASTLIGSSAHAATIVFQDNFDGGTSAANWITRQGKQNPGGTLDSSVDYAYDYSADLGIPAAPNAAGVNGAVPGSTLGMRFLVNQGDQANPANTTNATAAGVQAISAVHDLGAGVLNNDFKMQFDMWLNYIGPNNGVTASGSTQLGSFGFGTTGATAQYSFSSQGMLYAATTDGQSTSDYRLYKAGAITTAATGGFPAGSLDSSSSYYSPLGGNPFPAAQTSMFASQTGTTGAGTIGEKWRNVVIERTGNTVSWGVDGLLMSSTTVATLPGNFIDFGMFDFNAGASTDPNDKLNAAIFDNISVTTTPEPATWAMMAIGIIAMGLPTLHRKRSEAAETTLSPTISL